MGKVAGNVGKRMVQSVDRAVAILRALAAEPAGLSLKDLSARLGLVPQTVQSLVRTLEANCFVLQAGRGEPYFLGPGLLQLADTWKRRRDLASLSRPVCVELARELGEYVLLAHFRRMVLVAITEVHTDQPLTVRSEMDCQDHLHTMATARLLMAFMDEPLREAMIDSLTLTASGPGSVTDIDEFRCQLDRIRREDYCVCIEEAAPGVAAVAVAVRDTEANVVAALGIALPTVRFPAEDESRIVDSLRIAASKIEAIWSSG